MRQQEQVRRGSPVSSRLVLTLVFTAVQLWALVVVVGRIEVSGVLQVALALALGGTVLAVFNAWEELLVSRQRDSRPDR